MNQDKNIDLKLKLKKCELSFGSWITIGNPIISEIMAKSGFEWLTIDMEHSVINIDEAQNLIRVIDLSGCVPLVRVSENNPVLIKQAMDAGAYGVIVPMVNSEEDAEKAVRSVKYPPDGSRGVGLARAQFYGFGFDKYKKWLEKNSIVIVQIEHVEAVKNIDEILKTKDVDGFIVGPYDISGSLGTPGEFKGKKIKEIMNELIQASIKHKKPAGIHVINPDSKEVKRYIDIGYKFIAISLDTLYLGNKCKEVLKKVR